MMLHDSRLKAISLAAALFAVFTLTSCKNALEESAVKNSNEAYYFDAQRAMDSGLWDSAIAKLAALTPEFRARRDVVGTTASAYAGRCGLNMLLLAKSIADNSSTRLFPLLLSNFRTATTGSISDCIEAENRMRTLAPADDYTRLTPDENVFLAFVEFAKVGAILGTFGDLNHDGTVDPGFDSCQTPQLADNYLREIGTGLNIAAASLVASGSSIGSSAFSGISSACSSLPASLNFCGVFTPAGFSVNMAKALGGLVKAQDAVGVGTCTDTTPNCVCP